jgi:hypothetical protein
MAYNLEQIKDIAYNQFKKKMKGKVFKHLSMCSTKQEVDERKPLYRT